MVVDDKVLDQLIDFVETNKKYGFTRPSSLIGEYRVYKVRVELIDHDEGQR